MTPEAPPPCALFASTRVLVRFRDKKRAPEYCSVRELPLRLMRELSEAIHDDAALVALFLDIPLERTDEIHPDSVDAILAAGGELNFPLYAATVARRTARLMRLTADCKTGVLTEKTPSPVGPILSQPSS